MCRSENPFLSEMFCRAPGHHVTGNIWMMNNMLIENRRKSSDFSLCARQEVRRSEALKLFFLGKMLKTSQSSLLMIVKKEKKKSLKYIL